MPIWYISQLVQLSIESRTDFIQLSIQEFSEWSGVAHTRCTNVGPLSLAPLGGDAAETPKQNYVPQ